MSSITKHQFFLLAMKNEAYTRKEWFISVFSLSDATTAKGIIPYLLFKSDQGYYYLDPQTSEAIFISDGTDTTKPLLKFKEPIHVTPDDIKTVYEPIDTKVGIVIWNYLTLIDCFGTKIAYQNKEFTGKMRKKIYADGWVDDGDPKGEQPGFFPTKEALASVKNGFFLGGLSALCVPTTSRKALTINPLIIKRRDELFKEHEHELNNPVVMAKIQDELVAMDKADFKGDPAEDFFINDRFFSTSRKKMFISVGLEPDFNNNGPGHVVKNSLMEGWDPKDLPALVNSAIDASYDRGKSTAEGGAAVKELIRITQNINIVDEDCGTLAGLVRDITELNFERFVGSYYLDKDGVTHLITEESRGLIGKTLTLRDPITCNMSHTDFCQFCAGKHNSENRVGLSSSVVKMATVWMLLRMKKMHVNTLSLAHYDINQVFY